MKSWDQIHRQAEMYKKTFPEGTRIMLLKMGDDPRPVEDNTKGTVRLVDDMGTIHCDFDNGRALGIVPGEDRFRKLTEQEMLEEKKPALEDKIKSAQERSQDKKTNETAREPERA